jgi:hypothetical protein
MTSSMQLDVGSLASPWPQPNTAKMSRNISGAMYLARRSYNLHYNPTRLIHNVKNVGKRTEGERNMRKHFCPSSTTCSSLHPEFNPNRDLKSPADPKSNPEDCAPYDEVSGEYSRCGMRSGEYLTTDKKGEPYSPRGGDYRYGGRRRYEWRSADTERATPK